MPVIREIQIENFKSIKKMKLDLGRVNVFIGENGSGKSNILEAIALGGAAAADKLDNEFLASRGIRTAGANHMRCALDAAVAVSDINISVASDDPIRASFRLSNDGKPYSSWKCVQTSDTEIQLDPKVWIEALQKIIEKRKETLQDDTSTNNYRVTDTEDLENFISEVRRYREQGKIEPVHVTVEAPPKLHGDNAEQVGVGAIKDFVIYSPENQSLRIFQREGQIEPLGILGEGLLKFLKVLSETSDYSRHFEAIRERLKVLGWFEDLLVPDATVSVVRKIEIKDRYLDRASGNLDQISANEGFLFLLFYFCLFSTELTPRFFAVDNVDASLNPKLCAHLVTELAALAKANNKQAILTTHNPATLDGLDLSDDEQRLFVISRGDEGETKIRRIKQKDGSAADVKLSTAFINGYLGGLPKNF